MINRPDGARACSRTIIGRSSGGPAASAIAPGRGLGTSDFTEMDNPAGFARMNYDERRFPENIRRSQPMYLQFISVSRHQKGR